MRFHRPAPVIALLLRVQRKNRRQREDLQDARVFIDDLRHELAVQTRRSQRWRRTALELAPKVSPKAMDVCLMQVQSDDLADLPEAKGKR